jgi:hypothetical protein
MESEESSTGGSRPSTPGEQRGEGFLRLSLSRGRAGTGDEASRVASLTPGQRVAALKLTTALLLNRTVLFESLRAALPVLKGPSDAPLTEVLARLAETGGVVDFLSFVAAEEVAACVQETTLFRERGVYVELVSCLFKQPQVGCRVCARL